MQARRARLRREARLLATIIQEMNGRAIGRMLSAERNARQRPKTRQVFANTLPKGRLAGQTGSEAQGRITHRARPPSPLDCNSGQNKSGSNPQWEPLYSQMVAFFQKPDSGQCGRTLRTAGT